MAASVIIAPATGATCFYQWDLNQQLSVTGDVTEIHFAQPGCTTALVVPVKNGLVTIPNILLQNSGTLTAYAYTPDRTLTTQRWTIIARQKAEDYVYTETEVKTWETIEAEAANAIAIAQGVRDDYDTLIVTDEQNRQTAEQARVARDLKWSSIDVEVETLNPDDEATAELVQTENSSKFKFGVPKGEKGDKGDTGAQGLIGNVMYATFDIDFDTGELMMTTPGGYTGPTFSINDETGELEVSI